MTKIVSVYKIEGDTLRLGGYSIKYDENGEEISRTEPAFSGSITGPWQQHLKLLIGYEEL